MATPLKIKDISGNVQELTTSEENYIAYQIGLHLSADSADGVGAITTNSSHTSIGTYTDTFFNEPVGTHPSTSISSGSTVTTLYQNQGTAAETDSDVEIPMMWVDGGGETGFKQMPDVDLNAAVDRYLSTIFTGDYPGVFKLASSSPGVDYSVWLSSVFTDTRTDGSSTTYNIYRRNTYSAPTETPPMFIRDNGGFDGIQEMTDRQIKYSFGQRAKSRIGTTKIGSYQLRSASAGAPTDPGTWISAGSAVDTKQTTSEQSFTSTFAAQYNINYTKGYTRTYTGNYTNQYAGAYDRAYNLTYSRFVEVRYTANFAGYYDRTYNFQYTGTYNGPPYTVRYTGNFAGTAYASNYINQYSGNIDYLGNYTGEFGLQTSYISGFYYIGPATNFNGFASRVYIRHYYYVKESGLVFYASNFNIPNTSYQGPALFFLGSIRQYYASGAASYAASYSGAAQFLSPFVGYYGGTYYNITAAYDRASVSYSSNFIGTYNRTQTFSAGYSRTFAPLYVSGEDTVSASYTPTYDGPAFLSINYIRQYAQDYTGGSFLNAILADYFDGGAFTASYERNFGADYTSSKNVIYSNAYEQIYTQNYIGNFEGLTIDATDETVETYTLYVRIS